MVDRGTRRSNGRTLLAAVATAAAALTLAACGSSGSDDGGTSSGASAKSSGEQIKVGLAIAGPRNDQAFNQAQVDGLEDAGRNGVNLKLSVLDNLESPQAQTDALTNLARTNDVVVGGGAEFAQGIDALAAQFPQTYFILMSGVTDRLHENASSEAVNWGLAAYVAGVVAARTTETKTVGIVGGSEIPPTVQANAGYEGGVKQTDPSVTVRKTVVGSYNDAAKAKQAANAMVAERADSIFSFLDAGTQGVLQAAEDASTEVDAVSVIFPNCEDSPRAAGTAIYDFRKLTEQAIVKYADGRLKPGAQFYGLESPEIMRFELCPEFEDARLQKTIDQTTRAVVDGTADVPAGASYPEPSYAGEN